MTNLTEQVEVHEDESGSTPHAVFLQDVRGPGAYVCNWSGDLLRVTDKPVPADQLPPMPKVPAALASGEPPRVIKISDNPYIPISQARMAAANMDVEVNF